MTTLRDYTPDDLPACLAIFDSNVPEYFLDDERSEFIDFLADLPGPYLLVCDVAGEVLACGGYAVEADDGRADLCWGMVMHSRHRGGLGRVLTRARLDRAIADPRVRWVALSTSQLTTGFYEKAGFRTVSVTPEGYGPGLDRCDMRLDVDDLGAGTIPSGRS